MSVPSNLIPTRITQLPDAPEASPEGLLVYVLNGVTYKIAAGDLLQVAGVPTSRQVIAGTGMTGGGALSTNVTLSVANGGINATLLDATGVTAGSYGSGTLIPTFTVDENGRLQVAGQVPITAPGFGTVTSVDVSGGTTGLTFSGGPITDAGIITAAGTLAVANGGTGVTTSTGTGAGVHATSPTLVTPDLGTPSALVGTNITGTAAGLTAGNVTTNANLTGEVTSVGNAATLTNSAVIGKVLTGYVSGAGTVAATDTILQAINKLNGNIVASAVNLTGPITSVGNATSIASQTGTGTKFVVDTSPTLVTPNIGVATGTSLQAIIGNVTPAAGTFTTLAASGVTTVQAGTALLPAIIPTGDTNTGIWFPAADTIAVSTGGTERMRIDSAGNVGIGATSASDSLYVAKNISGATSCSGLANLGTVQSSVTSTVNYFTTYTQLQAAAFTLTNLNHYRTQQAAFSGGAAVTTQYGFNAESTLTGATNNYGFYSNIASAANRYNFYAAGSAPNYFAGKVGIGAAPFADTSSLSIGSAITGNNLMAAVNIYATVSSDVTTGARGYISQIGTTASAFTLPTLQHFLSSQLTVGAGSTVTSQYGFVADSTLTGATNNFGFYSNIASAANRYNFYAAGSAPNYFAGNVSAGGYLLTTDVVAAKNGTAIPAGGASAVLVSSTANFGLFFGSGAPTVSAAQGSLYLRSDGVPYYNSSGSTTWTGLQATLVSGTNIKTVGGVSLLGSGDVAVTSGLTLLATLTPTAAANVDFLTTFTSTYDNYLILIEGVKPASDDALRMRFAVAGTTDTGSVYFMGAEGTTPAATAYIGLVVAITSAGVGCGGAIHIQNANDATNAKTGSMAIAGQTAATPTFRNSIQGIGYNAANAISGFRLYWSGGANFAATGKVRVYGYANT